MKAAAEMKAVSVSGGGHESEPAMGSVGKQQAGCERTLPVLHGADREKPLIPTHQCHLRGHVPTADDRLAAR